MRKIFPLILFITLFSCLSDEDRQQSLVFDQIDRIEITVSDTVFLKGDETARVEVFASYFDQNGERVDLSAQVNPEVWIDGKYAKNGQVNTLSEGVFSLSSRLGKLESPPVAIKVVDVDTTTYLSKLEVDFSDSTRSNFGIAGRSRFDFVIRAFDYRGRLVPRPAELLISGRPTQNFQGVQFDQVGPVTITAKWGNYESDPLSLMIRSPFENNKTSLPIIFHVVHSGEEIGTYENPAASEIYEELENANLRFADQIPTSFRKSMNAEAAFIEFYPAANDPEDLPLPEAGIHRIETKTTGFDFINEVTRDFLMDNLWDPNRYVNVFVMKLDSEFSFAYFPSLRDPDRPNQAPGTLNYPFVSVLNLVGFDSHILAHELGHMLGVQHPFDSNETGSCTNTDRMEDTQDYINVDSNVDGAFRINCEGERFFSTNIMDYHLGLKIVLLEIRWLI